MKKPLAQYIDHTLLKPNLRQADIIRTCSEAHEYGFYSVCIPPEFVKDAFSYRAMSKYSYAIATVVSFPHGNATIADKVSQIKHAVENGTDELDVVINISNVISGNWARVNDEIRNVRTSTDKTVKYILEFGYLTNEQILKCTEMLVTNNIEFVKTSTGFGPRGATEDDVRLIKSEFGNKIKFKASGGIRDFDFASKLISLGVERLGTSSSIDIVDKVSSKLLDY